MGPVPILERRRPHAVRRQICYNSVAKKKEKNEWARFQFRNIDPTLLGKVWACQLDVKYVTRVGRRSRGIFCKTGPAKGSVPFLPRYIHEFFYLIILFTMP